MNFRPGHVFLLFAALLSGCGLAFVAIQTSLGWPLTLKVEMDPAKMRAAGNSGAAQYRMAVADGQPGKLFENAREIGVSVDRTDAVTVRGAGRFKTKSGRLYFSSSDGSDPSANGRRYLFVAPRKVLPLLPKVCLALVFASSVVWLFVMDRQSICKAARSGSEAWGAGFDRFVQFFSDRDFIEKS